MRDDKKSEKPATTPLSGAGARKTLEDCQKRVDELEEKYKRALADYQNLIKQTTKERQEWIKNANKELLLRLSPILDTLTLATKHSRDNALKVTLQQFLDIFKSEGVAKIETVGKDFDPYTMECVETAEGEEGRVIEEIRAGYMLYDRILRVAQVRVGKKEPL